MNRRNFLRIAGLASAGLPLLSACAPAASVPPANTATPASASKPAPTTAPAPAPTAVPAAPQTTAPTQPVSATRLKLPSFVPTQGVKPDLMPSPAGLQAGFFSYPRDLVKTVADPPAKGGDITAFTQTAGTVPPPLDQNAAWQAVNKALNANVKVQLVPASDYQTKTATTMAGNEFPDFFQFQANLTIGNIPQFLKTNYADLTPYLSGDAIKDYPNLANFPTLAWKQVIYNNAIYGVPVPYPLYLWVHWVHQNLLDQDGLARPKNANEYKTLAQHFTRPDQNLWGMGAENNVGMGITNGWLTGIFGVPNIWALDDKTGKLTALVETEQFRAAVSYARDLWSAGVFHPNAHAIQPGQRQERFRRQAIRLPL